MVHTFFLIWQLGFFFLVLGFICYIAWGILKEDLKQMLLNAWQVWMSILNYPAYQHALKRQEQQERIRTLEKELGFEDMDD